MTRMLAAELFKLRKRMMTWVLAVLLAGLVIMLYSILWSISGRATTFGEMHQFTGEQLRRALFLQTSVPFSLEIVASFGTIFAMILAAGAAGSEYSWGTIRLAATAASGRIRLLVAKLLVVCGLIIAGTLLAVAVAVAYSSVITVLNGGTSLDFVTAAFLRDQAAAFGRTLFVIAPYVALAYAMAVLGRSTLLGVGSGLGFAFMEPLIGGLMRLGGSPWEDIPRYFMNINVQVIRQQNSVPGALPRFGADRADLERLNANSPQEAAIILAIYSIVFIALACWVYRRRDITSG